MAEIISRKNPKGLIRYSYKCRDCNVGAGAWPEEKTVQDALKRHKKFCEEKKRCETSDEKQGQCLLKFPHHGNHEFPRSDKLVSEPLALV